MDTQALKIEREMSIKNQNDLDMVARWILELTAELNTNVVAFYGEMGSGKTTLIAEIARLMEVDQTPSSPTFALVNDYSNVEGSVIHHFDFYRINSPSEVFDLGYQDYFYSENLCLLEWPELIEQLLPEATLRIKIKVAGEHSREYSVL